MNNITVYSKFYCPYCKAAKQLLASKGLAFTEIEVANNEIALREMLDRSHNRKTVPQIFFGDRHIGGYTDLVEHFKTEDVA